MKNTLPKYRKQRILSAILVFLIFAMVSPCFAKYSGGSGEPNNPYQISSAEDLLSIAVNIDDYNNCFILTADINLASSGVFSNAVIGGTFTGVFDGAGHNITNMKITDNGVRNDYLGLFNATSGEIKNLGIENASISAGSINSSYFGGLAGQNFGIIRNCHVNGNIAGGTTSFGIGGLVGLNYGTIINSYSQGAITGHIGVGGLAGYSTENVSDSYFIGSITGIYQSYPYTGSSRDLGGLIGFNYGNVSRCFSMGWASGGTDIGGLIGESDYNNITDCYSTFILSGEGYLGGQVGFMFYGTISNCYATGTVTGTYGVGGLIGGINYSTLTKCYSTGQVSGSYDNGGLLGYNVSGSVNDCYYPAGRGPDNGYGTPLLDSQMKLKASFVGWDFSDETANGTNDFWWLCNEGLEYPRLWWQYLPGDLACPGIVGIEDLAVLCEQWLLNEIPADAAPSGGDGIIDFIDFAVFANQWIVTNNINDLLDFSEQWLKMGIARCSADISPWPDGDRIVNFSDFAVMADNWQACFVGQATIYSPAQDFVSTSRSLTLQWLPGKNYLSHDLFFGTDFNSVSSADTSSAQFMGNQITYAWSTNNYAPSGLDLNTIYYWRVDETALECKAKGDVWRFGIAPLGKAANPKPSSGQQNITSHTVLSWSPATYAASHDIYFGTDYNNAIVATHSSVEYMGSADANHWDINNFSAGGLGYSTTYYWRIDELKDVNITKGDIWSFTTCPEPNIGYGLAAWWKFDESNGIIAYDSVGHSDGNLVGGPVWTNGKIGGGLSFDGINDYVNCGSGPSNYDNITVSVWMKTSTYGTLVSNRYNSLGSGTWYTLYSRSIVIGDNSHGGSKSLTFKTPTLNGLWHHIVYTKDGVNHTVYVDGFLDQQFISNADISRNVPLLIGIDSTYPEYLFTGIIDEVRIYNRALSEEEVALLYAQ
jgi:hypothetical protein